MRNFITILLVIIAGLLMALAGIVPSRVILAISEIPHKHDTVRIIAGSAIMFVMMLAGFIILAIAITRNDD